MKYKGTLIITDPCYIVKSDEDWHLCEFGERLDLLGIPTFLSCDRLPSAGFVRNLTEDRIIGEYCTDSCVTSIMSYDELMAYYPDCLKNLAQHCYTLISDFDGEVAIIEDVKGKTAFVGTGKPSFTTE